MKNADLSEPIMYLSILVGFATVLQILYTSFPGDVQLVSYLNISVAGIWISITFKGLELFWSDSGGFRKLSRDSALFFLCMAIFIQGLFLASKFSIIWNSLPGNSQIFIGGLVLLGILSKYYPRSIKFLIDFTEKLRDEEVNESKSGFFMLTVLIVFGTYYYYTITTTLNESILIILFGWYMILAKHIGILFRCIQHKIKELKTNLKK